MTQKRFDRPRLAVVKVGSSSLRAPSGRLDIDQLARLSEQLVVVHRSGTAVVLVSSGAVASGMGVLGMERRPADVAGLQAAAAVGQGELIHAYHQIFASHGLSAAQILLSQDDFVRRSRYLNARTALQRLLTLDVIPVINENDAVATEELSYGDNDHLAALVASMLEAQVLLLLSDVEGLFDRDPADPGANLIDQVDRASDLDLDRIGGTGSHVGSGGMRTKVEAAQIAVASAAHAVVADARRPDVIIDALDGERVGSWFVAGTRRLEARRLWIGFALTVHGTVTVDEGAKRALVDGGKSLLAVGVTEVDGDFTRGDAIQIVDADGRLIARGLTNYDRDELRRIAGMSSEDAVAEHGNGYRREVVHRDDLVLRWEAG